MSETNLERVPIPKPVGAIASRNPLRWLTIFGPGAIVASLTIGTGELIFSSRGGAIFGYSVLWIFLFVSLLKWAMVFASARHIVLSGGHIFDRWTCLPGPRGWLPIALLVPSVVAIPIWIGFLSGTVGTLFQDLSGIDKHICGAIALALVSVFVFAGGYSALEKVQLFLVGAMLIVMGFSAILMNPDWLAVAKGFLVPTSLSYPAWLREVAPKIADEPLLIEISLYVGIVGGASYDYVAYVSFLREKHWGFSGEETPVDSATLDRIANLPADAFRNWVRAPLIDCAMSFLAVIAFSAVFVISGTLALGPKRQIPSGDNLLNLQAEFVTQLHEWLYPLYVVGATMTLIGTLYGTTEVGPAIYRELFRSINPKFAHDHSRAIRLTVCSWGIIGGFVVLAWSYWNHRSGNQGNPPTLVEIVKPAALFTHVFSCATICFLNPWMDQRFLPRALRMNGLLVAANLLAGVIFLLIGLKSYWDYGSARSENAVAGGVIAVGSMLVIVAIGAGIAWIAGRRSSKG